MYAIIATGGKQYKVSEGDIIKVEKRYCKMQIRGLYKAWSCGNHKTENPQIFD